MEINDNIIESRELEQMRSQLSLLKHKVSKQDIVNEQLMRKVMSDKVSKLNKNAVWLAVLALVSVFYCTWVFEEIGLSTAFLIVTDAFFLLAIAVNYWSHRGIKANSMLDGDLIDTRLRLMKLKRNSGRWLYFGIPYAILWFAWLCYEIITMHSPEMAKGMILGGVVGGVIGATAAYSFYRKNRRRTIEVIEEIAELIRLQTE